MVGPLGLLLDAGQKTSAAKRDLAGIIDALRERMGKSVVMRGHDLLLREQQRAYEAKKSSTTLSDETARHRLVVRNPVPINYPKPAPRPVATSYVPLDVHSCYDFLNSTLSVPQIVMLASKPNCQLWPSRIQTSMARLNSLTSPGNSD